MVHASPRGETALALCRLGRYPVGELRVELAANQATTSDASAGIGQESEFACEEYGVVA